MTKIVNTLEDENNYDCLVDESEKDSVWMSA